MKSEIFSPDALEFLRVLEKHDVRFLLVGGIAVIYYGHARFTGDTDYLYQPSRRNAERLHAALLEFWAGSIPGDIGVDQLLEANQIFQFGRSPNRIDLMNSISGVGFEEAWTDRREDEVRTPGGPIAIHLIGLRSLRINKASSGRPKDLDDLAHLPEPE